jgi:hypothetical protein
MMQQSLKLPNMKKMIAIKCLRILLVLVLLCTIIFTEGYAQGPDDPSENDPAIPADGGIGLLLAAGVAYGIRKYRSPRRNEGANN